jgi:hypothetical protein
MAELSREELEAAKVLLEDLLEGREQLLTAGEVAELLNINVNTLYLWRASGEVDLPFQRFISPGQTRGVIRYRYSDVVLFLARAVKRGEEEAELEEVEGSTDEDGVPIKIPAPAARKKNTRRKAALKEKLQNTPLEELLKATPEGLNLTAAEHREQRRTELAPPPDAVEVDNPGGIVYDDTPAEEPESQEPEATVEAPSDTEAAAAAAWLARFNAAFTEGAPPNDDAS